jgi:hypothetical protein
VGVGRGLLLAPSELKQGLGLQLGLGLKLGLGQQLLGLGLKLGLKLGLEQQLGLGLGLKLGQQLGLGLKLGQQLGLGLKLGLEQQLLGLRLKLGQQLGLGILGTMQRISRKPSRICALRWSPHSSLARTGDNAQDRTAGNGCVDSSERSWRCTRGTIPQPRRLPTVQVVSPQLAPRLQMCLRSFYSCCWILL